MKDEGEALDLDSIVVKYEMCNLLLLCLLLLSPAAPSETFNSSVRPSVRASVRLVLLLLLLLSPAAPSETFNSSVRYRWGHASLPLNRICLGMLFVGLPASGKTYGMKRVVEELCLVPSMRSVVILDVHTKATDS